ncbi:CPBP family intramembrane glutamic endopeptidase [Calothrix sp. UHCC 0171]|uniref:CPBP family intramembrane glutamic endopeptidase n=1 Tax=Calothrix sp. UHCC 0171 TaxID=3110245 RepID=UPI002B1F5B76|nr:CPBP family glutamic-type intramembrane protease [Calothrix sp. UHCC 0171]MEA5571948.1 CPBP family glutamic-type intramembrane protease [Calothrix sp. UHCC 0171]
MDLTSLAKPKIAILVAFLYTAFTGFGMFYTKAFRGITYGSPEMMNIFWFFVLVGFVMTAFVVTRYFGWSVVGFRKLDSRKLLWFTPYLALLTVMWTLLLRGLATTSLSAAQWQLFAIAGFTTLFVGINEEVIYRGMLLHGFLKPNQVFKAVLFNGIGFSLLHSVNVFAGAPPVAIAFQLFSTFLFGLVFGLMMLKLNHILPLILFHWFWDFALFTAPIVSPQVATTVSRISAAIYPIEIVVGVLLWLNLRKKQDAILDKIGITF